MVAVSPESGAAFGVFMRSSSAMDVLLSRDSVATPTRIRFQKRDIDSYMSSGKGYGLVDQFRFDLVYLMMHDPG